MKSQKVTIYIAAFNAEKTILSCINSILNQSTKFDEILIIDDKSNDNTVKILKSNPFGVLLFYDKGQKIQLRISGKTKVNYQNEITKKSWKKTAHMSRQCYLGDFSPGLEASKPTSGLSESIDNLKYSFEESEFGYKNFSVVEVVIKSIEWLYLAAKGHRRAYFQFKNGEISKKWLIP